MKMWQHDFKFNFSMKDDFIALLMPRYILLTSSNITHSHIFDKGDCNL